MDKVIPRADLLGLTYAQFQAWSRGLAGHSDRFHRALYWHLVSTGRWSPGSEPLWAAEGGTTALAALTPAAAAVQMPTVAHQRVATDADLGATVKIGAVLADGRQVESVLIPMNRGAHHTVCVSSQVGCKMGCTYCHTATMGLVRQLTAHEITGQVLAVQAATGVRPRNVVFMGMGEPLDNAEAVAQAVRVFTDAVGFGLARRHVTISTVGRVDQLARWADLGLTGVNLAVSLGAADDAVRSELMPVNRVAPLAILKAALLGVPLPDDRRILVGYTVIPGVNDSTALMQDLIRWCAGLRVLVNLIPYNPIPSRTWRAPTASEVMALRDALDRAGVPVRVRLTKGDEVMAACGQLGEGRIGQGALKQAPRCGLR